MKKKIVALILTVALISTFFVGCTLFETDADRDYHQVVANVTYNTKDSGTLSAVVYKGEVKTQINMYVSYLSAQLGWDADQIVEYCYNNVARQKLMLLYAQEYLYLNKLVPDSFPYDKLGEWNDYKNKDVKNYVEAYAMFLTVDELRYCIENVNKQFDDSWKDLIEDREEEESKNDGNNGETASGEDEDKVDDSDLLEARAQKDRKTEDDEDDEYEVNESIKTREDIVKYFADKYDLVDKMDVSKLSDAYFFNYAGTLVKKEVGSKKKIMSSTLNELKKNVENQYMDYDYFLVQQMQSRIIAKYTDHVGTVDEIIRKVNDNYKDRYNGLVEDALTSYNTEDNSAYNTAVGDKTFAYATPSKDYLQVKSILLSFTDEQKSAITSRTEQYGYVEDVAKILRNAYATGIVADEYKDWALDVYADLGIKVNVSNPDYDAEEDKLVDAYTDASIKDKEEVYANPSVDFMTVLAAMANDIQAKVDKAVKWASDSDMSEVEKYLVKQYASQEAFNDWINLVNDDGGMVSTDVYAVTPDGESSSYVEEYTVLARALTNAGVGAAALKDYDTTDATVGNINYEGTTEILKGGNGAYTLYRQNIKTSVGEYTKDYTADVYTLVTESGAKISFIVNEFGIHVVMVASLPIDENLGSISEQTVKDAADESKDKTFYVKNDDYLYEYSVKVEYKKETTTDEEGNETETDEIETITVETKTIKAYLEETITDEFSNDVTTLQRLNLFDVDSYINKVDKVYKQVVKEVKDALN